MNLLMLSILFFGILGFLSPRIWSRQGRIKIWQAGGNNVAPTDGERKKNNNNNDKLKAKKRSLARQKKTGICNPFCRR